MNTSKPLKVLFIPTMNSGVMYYRMYQYKEAMNRLGLAEAAMPFYSSEQDFQGEWQWYADKDYSLFGSRGLLVHLIKEADVIVTQYIHTPQALALMEGLKATFQHPDVEAQHGKKVFLAEVDDDVLDTPPWNAAYEQYGPNQAIRATVVEFLRAMDGIVVTTPFLAQKYRELNKHVYQVRNSIQFGVWDKHVGAILPGTRKEIRIGWAGGAAHDDDLATIEKPIKEILAKNKGVSFHLMNGCPEFFKNQSKITWHAGFHRIDKYPRALAALKFDIGIAPLVDCDFNRGKSNLRKLEYGAMRIPVVASDVGHFHDTVHHGKDGFLYKTPEQFKQCLQTLIDVPGLIGDMGHVNNEDIRKNFNTDKVAAEYVEILREARARGNTRPVDVAERRGTKWIDKLPATTSL